MEIALTHVCKSFDKKSIIKDMTFTVQSGDIICLLGPSGSGKTTTIRLLIGAIAADSGEIKFGDTVIPNLKLLKNIGFMPQNDAMYDDLSGEDNLKFFSELYGMRKSEAVKRIDEVLNLVDLTADRKKFVRNYSGGMKKRLSLAAALLHEPDVLLLDEPTVGIDPVLRRTIWKLKDEDFDTSWSEETSTIIALNGNSATVTGGGASVSSGTVTITKAGTYVVSGVLSKGQIYVNAGTNDTVRLVLDGVDITAAQNAAIYAAQADKLIIVLADGTTNKITDAGTAYTYTDTAAEEPNAAVFSKCDLSITGNGVLTVSAGFNNGIGTKDDLVITGGQITVNAANHGIRGRDSVTITGGSFDITANNDGIQTNNDEDTSKGWINIVGGTFIISVGDDGIHSDSDLNIDGGNIEIVNSYEGIEGANVNISNGKISIVSSDDGINAAGGNDGGTGGTFGKDQFRQGGNYSINISGGEITLVAGGDGLDSNGSVTVTGGTIISLINSTPDNGAIDCDGTLTATGGTIIYGGTGVGQVPGGNSTQSYAYVSGGISAGPEVKLQKDGQTIISFTPAISCQYLTFSSPDIASGQSYTVVSGAGTSVSVTAGTGGGMGGMGGPGGPGGGGRKRPGG